MNWFLLIAQYLPLVMSTVTAVEQTVHAPGATKAKVALDTIQMVSQIAGQTVPETHVQLIASLVNGVVDTFNKTGVFTKASLVPAAK